MSSISDTQGRTTTFTYNAANLVASVVDPGSRLYQYVFDPNKNLTSYTDPANKVTSFAYNAANDLTQITTPAGRAVTFAYDTAHRVTSIGHPLQLVMRTRRSDGRISNLGSAEVSGPRAGALRDSYALLLARLATSRAVLDRRLFVVVPCDQPRLRAGRPKSAMCVASIQYVFAA